MDKDILIGNHNINLVQRKNISITGVKKIDNFDENEFYIESNMGNILIHGSNLEIIKLDTYQGEVSIKGKIDSLAYIENNKTINKESFLTRLFK